MQLGMIDLIGAVFTVLVYAVFIGVLCNEIGKGDK